MYNTDFGILNYVLGSEINWLGSPFWAMNAAIFRRITLPLLKPVILIVLIFRTLDAFRVFDAVYVLTGGGPANTTETLSIYAYKVLFQTLQFGYGSTLSVVVFLCTGAISVFYIKLLSRGMRQRDRNVPPIDRGDIPVPPAREIQVKQ